MAAATVTLAAAAAATGPATGPAAGAEAAVETGAGLAGPPRRVVSMNLCTDQLAMLIAAPGQLVSISYLAADPRLSPMAAEASRYPANRGGAEQILLMRPDVVLADQWSDPAAVAMLRRLGVRVEQFDPGQTTEAIRANILRMGALLGREEAAGRVLAGYDAALAAIPRPQEPRPRAAVYGPNGWADGPASLAGRILEAAGYANVAAELGYGIGGTLPLEVLVVARPDLVIVGEGKERPARAEEILVHPALAPFRSAAATTDATWVCPGPFVADAVRALAGLRVGGRAR